MGEITMLKVDYLGRTADFLRVFLPDNLKYGVVKSWTEDGVEIQQVTKEEYIQSLIYYGQIIQLN